MRMLVPGAFAIAVSAGAAWSAEEQPAYDRRIDEAAAAIVASRMGELRGGFGMAEQPALVRPRAPRTAPSAPAATEGVSGEWLDGLAIAVEPPRRASPDL